MADNNSLSISGSCMTEVQEIEFFTPYLM